jgi:electron transport complex protein RnfB
MTRATPHAHRSDANALDNPAVTPPLPEDSSPADALRHRLDCALPQTQCTRCGFADCKAYATAMALGQAEINRCPPGGAVGIGRLAALTGKPPLPLDPACGSEAPRRLAVIDEAWCIGCTLCIKACPVDCIVGAPKHMHTVLARWCTGCELCLPVCPVDCIDMRPESGAATGWDAWSPTQAQESRERYAFHVARRERDLREDAQRLASKAQARLQDLAGHSLHTDAAVLEAKRAVIEAALKRASEPAPDQPDGTLEA